VIKISANISKEHADEMSRLHNDGFFDGFSYKNAKGESRMILQIMYPMGTEGDGIRALGADDTVISFIGERGNKSCSISEWYNWLGDKWGSGDPVAVSQPDPIAVRANAISEAYTNGKNKTKPFEKKETDEKWVPHSLNSKKKSS
jgi:hypothetical protein